MSFFKKLSEVVFGKNPAEESPAPQSDLTQVENTEATSKETAVPEPESSPEPETVPKPENSAKPSPEPKPQPAPEPAPEPQPAPELAPEPQPAPKPEQQRHPKSDTVLTFDPVKLRAQSIDKIIGILTGVLGHEPSVSTKTLTILSDDNLVLVALDNNEFKDILIERIINTFHDNFKEIKFEFLEPDRKGVSQITDDLYLYVEDERVRPTLIDMILERLADKFGPNSRLSDKSLTVYSKDPNNLPVINNNKFKTALSDRVFADYNDRFHEISIQYLDPNADGVVKVTDDLYIFVDKYEEPLPQVELYATVEASGCGSLADGKVELAPNGTYNIGVGRHVDLRTNHIAVSDDPNDPQFPNNCRVSRTHAHITYSSQCGAYLLYVEPKGTQMMGKRTRIFRNPGEVIEMNNPMWGQKLLDGDIIELSKSVRLLFKIKH